MTPQAKTAPALRPEAQQTPVIIKVGGDLLAADESKDTIPVMIESLFMPFDDPVPGPTWETARSTQTGRIIEVTFKDGDNPRQDFPINPSEELVSVRIEHGVVQLVAMESGMAPDNVFLTFASIGVPFNDTPTDEGWTESTADLPPITGVVIMQGSTVLKDYHFENPKKVDLNVQFLLNV